MTREFVIVFGAKKNTLIPNVDSKTIYSANSAVVIGSKYKEKFRNTKHICVVPAKAYYKIDEIKKAVRESKPDVILSRFGKINYNDLNNFIPNLIEIENFSNFDQLKFQSKFIKYGILNVLFSELYYKKKFFNKTKHLIQCLTWRNFMGCSTGVYCILKAAYDNPNSNILISGISLEGGPYFQGSRNMTEGRAEVDKYFLKHISDDIKSRLFTLDKEMSMVTGIKVWDGETL